MDASDDLLRSMKAAVKRTVAAVHAEHPQESLAGYALLTGHSLVTLTYMAITTEALASSGDSDLLFCPTDWPQDPDSAAFDVADRQLREIEMAPDSQRHVSVAFATLVRALAEIKAEGLFSPGVFLSVLSTDPSPELEALESSSVQQLNRQDLVRAREQFLRKWA
jgi:hypothetical protein